MVEKINMEVEKNQEMSFRSSGNLSFHYENNKALNSSRLSHLSKLISEDSDEEIFRVEEDSFHSS
jgi:hypothetical protein